MALAAPRSKAPIGSLLTRRLRHPRGHLGSELFGPLLMREEPLTTPLHYSDGELHLPDGPGLGVELDPEAVARFRRS